MKRIAIISSIVLMLCVLFCVAGAVADSETTNAAAIKMQTSLTITTQPKSVTVANGATAKVTVAAKGEGLTYTWYVKPVGQTRFNKSSITSSTYSVAMNSARNGNQLYCVVKDKNGNTVKSNTVTIKMKTPLAITTQPKSVTVAKYSTAKVTVVAKGDGLTYTWYVKPVGQSSFNKSSITSSTYSVVMNSARDGNQLYCVVKDKYGKTVKTNTVTIKATSVPACDHRRNCDEYVCCYCGAPYYGDYVGHDYQHKRDPDQHWLECTKCYDVFEGSVEEHYRYCWGYSCCQCGLPYEGSNVEHGWVYEFNNLVHWGECFDCGIRFATERHECLYDNTGTAHCYCGAEIKMRFTEQPKSVTVFNGEAARVSVKAEGYDITYTWYVKPVGESAFKKSTITGKTYSVKMNSTRNGNQVYCVLTDKAGNTVKSNTVTIKMKTPLAITTQPKSVTVAKYSTAKVSVVAKGDGLTYTWYVKAVGTSSFKKSSNTGSTYSVTMNSDRNGNQVYCVVKDKYGSTVKTNTVTLKMK